MKATMHEETSQFRRKANGPLETGTVYIVRKDGNGISCSWNKKLAERLLKAVNAGHPLDSFHGRTLNADLKRIGF